MTEKKQSSFLHNGAGAILGTMFIGAVGFLSMMIISNAQEIATVKAERVAIEKAVDLMRVDFNNRLDRIDNKLDQYKQGH